MRIDGSSVPRGTNGTSFLPTAPRQKATMFHVKHFDPDHTVRADRTRGAGRAQRKPRAMYRQIILSGLFGRAQLARREGKIAEPSPFCEVDCACST